MGPVREYDEQPGTAIDIRITVEGDVDVLDVTGVLDQAEEAVGAAAAGDRVLIEVRDVGSDATPSTDLQRLTKGVQVPVAESVAHVRVVDAAQTRGLGRETDQLVGAGVP